MAAPRPMLMDKQWERIQEKTFTKWVNSHMMKRGGAVTNLVESFKDGLQLIQFFEIISNKDIGAKYEKKPKMRIQMIQNVSTALKFLAEQKVKLVSISAEDIVDGNLKLVLGMIWTIILRFQIEDISVEELSSRDALLLWCKKKTEGYRDCKVENFHTSWQDGMAFCAIIHRHRPDLINYDALSKNNARENLKLAFEIAEKEFGIPQLLDLEDIVDIAKPDERSIITYVSQYYHYFSAGRKQEVAGRRIGKLVDMTTSIEQMKADYADRAKKLAEWIANKTNDHSQHNFPNDGVQGIKDLIQQFTNYKENEKPEKAAEKLALETLFNSIALKLRSNNRSAFVPPEGASPSDLQNLWEKLLGAERDRDDALRKELERQERLDLLKRRFNQKADKLEAWISAKDKYLQKDEVVDSLNAAQERIKYHETFYGEYDSTKPRLQELEEIAKEISSLNDPHASSFGDRVKTIGANWGGLKGKADDKKVNLQKKLEIQQKMEELRIDFAKHAKEYNRWAGSSIDSINDHTFGDSLEAVTAYRDEMNKDDQKVTSESKEKVQKLQNLWNEMQSLGITDLKYTVLTIKDIEGRHGQIEEALKKRQSAYEDELKRQLEMEQKRKEFAKLAQEFVDHLAARKEAIQKLEGEPEPLIEAIKQNYNDGHPEKEKLNHVAAFYTQMIEMGINENKHTEYTPALLSSRSDQLGSYVRNYIGQLNDEKELKALYASRAKDILDWISENFPHLKDISFDNTLVGAQTKNAEFQQYKTGPKAEAAAKKPEIERLYSSIAALLKKSHRPEFNPPSGLSLQDIDNQWKALEDEERKKEEALQKELHRQEHLAMLVRRFNSDAGDLESWAGEKVKYLSAKDEIPSLFKAQFAVKLFEAYLTEFQSRQSRVKQLEDLKNEIVNGNYNDSKTIVDRYSALQATLSSLEQHAGEKQAFLHAELEKQQKYENMRYELARQTKEFNSWVKDSIETIEDHNFGFTLSAVNAHKQELDNSDNNFKASADEKQNAINALFQEMQQSGIPEPGKHSQHSVEDVASIRKNLEDALAKRRHAYEEEVKRQNAAEELRKVFASKAKEFIEFLAKEKGTLEGFEGEISERMEKIKSHHNDGAAGKAHLEELSKVNSQLKTQGIYDNSHTNHTLPSITSKNNQHNLHVASMIAALVEEEEMQERIKAQEAELRENEKKENMVLQFSAQARALNFWMENADEILNDPINCSSLEDAEKLVAGFHSFEQELGSKKQDHAALVALAQQMKEANITDFSGVTIEELTDKWNEVNKLTQDRKVALEQEHKVQKVNDEIAQKFAKQAKDLSNFIQQQKDKLAATKGELDAQLHEVQNLRVAYEEERKAVTALEETNKQSEKAGIKRNKYTDLTLRSLHSEYEQLGNAMAKQETLLTNEIMAKKGSDVSPEQLSEFKEVFKHFDKNHDGSLGRVELKACLQALGDEPSDQEMDTIMSSLDPEGKGVSFESFANFMVKKTKDTDSKDEILVSFKELAGDKDYVTEEDLRRVMTPDRVAYLLKNMPKYKDVGYDYKAWVEQAYH